MTVTSESDCHLTMFTIRAVTAEATRPLRHKILRPHLPFETTAYPNDYDNDTLHVGAFVNDDLVGIATVFRAPMPVEQDSILLNASWQLRGMAVKEKMRGKGFGAALVRACIQHITQHGGGVLWCNGRTSALKFYQSLEFQTIGEEFESPSGTGPHFVMWRYVKETA